MLFKKFLGDNDQFIIFFELITSIYFFIVACLGNRFQMRYWRNNWKEDVLLWAVLSNRKELANLFWLRSKHKICKLNLLNETTSGVAYAIPLSSAFRPI